MAELPNIQIGTGTIIFWKNEGETPLEALGRLRIEQPKLADAVLTYAGRLDPIAEGVLLVLVGEENKNREKYLNLDKEYEVEVLFGLATDTGDVLGIVQKFISSTLEYVSGSTRNFSSEKFACSQAVAFREPPLNILECSQSEISRIIQSVVGWFSQPYPHYSSKTVGGKPLFQWAREGRLEEIEIPTKEVEIYSIEQIEEKVPVPFLTGEEILKQVENRIAKVNGDFRQREILQSWQTALKTKEKEKFSLIKIKVCCSSGTYMRTLAENIGRFVGVPALAWSIKRTKIIS